MNYVVYDTVTGEILSSGVTQQPEFLPQPPEGQARLFGEGHPHKHKVVAETIVELPSDVQQRRGSRPPHPARWDWNTLDWVDERTPEQAVQAQRDSILRQIAALERQQLRSVRELTIGRGNQSQARQALEALDDQITVLRNQLP